MRALIIFVLLATKFTHSFSQFEITGTAKGMADSTVLYLDYKDGDEKMLDSATVVGEKFIFKGQLTSKAVHAMIKTRDFSDYKFFWVENASITFSGKKGNFREAGIRGSAIQDQFDEFFKSTDKISEKERIKLEQQYVRDHPHSIISAYILSVYTTTWGKEISKELYNQLSDEMRNTAYGKTIADFVSLNKNIKVGDKYADFEQEDTENKVIKLSDFDNKVVLLEFWGSWCGPCRETNPELVKIYTEFKDKGFEILGVGAETSKTAWLNAIEKDKLTWTNVTDLKGDKNKAALIYGISYYPTNFLIDQSGTIIAKDIKGDKLRRKLKELLGQ